MLSLLTITAAYSSGGSLTREPDQSCDAIGICPGDPPLCPKGMDKVRAPGRGAIRTRAAHGRRPQLAERPDIVRAGRAAPPLYLRVTRPKIMGKGYCQMVDKFGGVRDTLERCDRDEAPSTSASSSTP